MISSTEFQSAYNWFYEEMRKYIWDLDVVEILAELEVTAYDAFVDREKLLRVLTALEREIREFFEDDQDLKDSFDGLMELAESDEKEYVPLFQVNEVLIKEETSNED